MNFNVMCYCCQFIIMLINSHAPTMDYNSTRKHGSVGISGYVRASGLH